MKQFVFYFVCGLFVSNLALARVWTAKGGRTVEAAFLKVDEGKVWLQMPDGREMAAPFNSFVEADQEEIKRLYHEAEERAKQEENQRIAELKAKWPPGQTITRVTPGAVSVTYHVYIPSTFDHENPPPLVFAFSPKGNGRGQLNKMKASAEKAGWIVVGCDGLKNGMTKESGTPIEDALLKDVQEFALHDPERVFLSGFSGGALRSYMISSRRRDLKVAGVLAFGGWLGGRDAVKNYDFSEKLLVAIVNGDRDDNANAWVDRDMEVLRKDRCKVKTFSFSGGHTMAPRETIDEVVEWLEEELR